MEDKIIELLIQQNSKSLELLKENYNTLLSYIISTILHNKEDVEECLNDTYLKIWNNAQKYDYSKASLKTYLAAIARNTAINRLEYLKSKKRCNQVLLDDEIYNKVSDESKNIEENFLNKEQLGFIIQMINNFNSIDKELMYRRYYYNQPSKLIAKALNMSVGAVDVRICKLRKKLKKEYIRHYMQKGGNE